MRSYVDILDSEEIKKEKLIQADYESDQNCIKMILDISFNIFKSYDAVLTVEGEIENEFYQMGLSLIYKNINYLYTAYKLTGIGQYSVARLTFRNVYESLIILKANAIKSDLGLLEKWKSGENINLKANVFRKVDSPNSRSMLNFWDYLCKLTHSTKYSIQTMFDYKKEEVDLNYTFILILLYLNFHVLNRYIANRSLDAKVDRLIITEEGSSLKEQRDGLKKAFSLIKKEHSKETRSVINDFCKVWRFK